MRGSGGGGFIYMGGPSHNPEGTLIGLALLATVFGVGYGVYKTAEAFDGNDRAPYAASILTKSAKQCTNAATNPGLYHGDLKEHLSGVWSSTHEQFKDAHGNVVICEDPAANAFVLKKEFLDASETKHDWELRIAGIHYVRPGGEEALVVTTKPNQRPANSTDTIPDDMLEMAKIMNALDQKPYNAGTVLLKDGTRVTVMLQRDGVTQSKHSNKTYDEDGVIWAGDAEMKEIMTRYSFTWPLHSTGAVVASADMTPKTP